MRLKCTQHVIRGTWGCVQVSTATAIQTFVTVQNWEATQIGASIAILQTKHNRNNTIYNQLNGSAASVLT